MPKKEQSTANLLIKPGASISELRQASKVCRACDLWKLGTQTVFGEGARGARVIFVGEQPGDAEDRQGRPFVGPAGALLREVLTEAGIAAERAYLTNAVKHFKWRPSGKRRIHDKPNASEVRACGHWLEREMAGVSPELVV